MLAGVANLATLAASLLAIFLWLKNRHKISSAFALLLDFSYQLTLGELKEKLERLNEYNANEASEVEEIRNILHEIAGQISGNSRLVHAMPGLSAKFESLAGRKLSEPLKRALVSELREKIRTIQVSNFEVNL
ncbi:hypothetical protein EJI00_23725 [Variovorax sp. DXTD-1]|nr:hypothetical protein EJI00_23725 [Variovorax sp. DXTD-1]